MEISAIRRLTIQARTEGTEQAAASLRQLSAAQKDVAATGETVATVTDISSRKQLSASQAYERLMRSMDATARAQYQFSQGFRVLDAVAKQGSVSTDQYLHSLELLYQRYAAATGQGAKGAQAMARETGKVSYEAKNLSFQIVDVTQGILSGQSAFMIFAQQAGQIGQVIATSPRGLGGLMRELGESIASAITPMRLAGAAVVGAGVAVYAAYSSWKSFALALDDTARIAGTTTSQMAKLQAVASFKGIDGASFADAMGKFSQATYQARNNMGELAEVFRANGGIIPRDTESSLYRVANLIRAAGSDIQRLAILQQAGLPATMEWVRLLRDGGASLKAAQDAAAQFGGTANDQMVKKAREFDEAWNKAWTNFGLYAKNAGLAAVKALDDVKNHSAIKVISFLSGFDYLTAAANKVIGPPKLTAAQQVAARFPGSGEFKSSTPTVDPNVLKNNINLEQQRIGILGELATVSERMKQKENEITLARLAGVKITGDEQRALLNLAAAQALASKNQEAASLGLFSNARAQAQLNAELQAAIDKKLFDPATPGQYAAALTALGKRMEQLRDQAMVAAAPLEQLKRLQLDAANLRTGFDQFATASLNSMTDNLAAFAVGTKSAAQAFRDFTQSVLMDLAKLLIRQNIVGPLAGLLQGAFGGFFGGFGGFGGAGSRAFGAGAGAAFIPSAHGNVFYGGNVVPFARGGVVNQPTIFPMANGAGLMGEAGPEAVMPLRRLGNGDLGVQTAGGGAPTIQIIDQRSGSAPPIETETGLGPGGEMQVRVIVRDAIDQFSRQALPGRMQQIQRNPRKVG